MKNKGFSLVEIILVVAIIAILGAIILVTLNPPLRIKEARDSARWEEAGTIANAVAAYSVDNRASLPAGVSTDFQMIGTATSGCDVTCGTSATSTSTSATFTDDDEADFLAGTFTDTQWDAGNAWVELNPVGLGAGTGSYTSGVKDAGDDASWDDFSWIPEMPFYKELPDSGASESGYPSGNANMSGNVVLTHMNESSGNIIDTSGQGNDGTYNGALYSQTGELNTAIGFDVVDDTVSIADAASLDITGDITIEAWVYPTDVSGWPDLITKGGYSESYSIDIQTDGTPRFGLNGSFLSAGSAFTMNEWNHLVMTRQGSTRSIYINGSLSNSDTYGTAIGTTATPLTYSTASYPFGGRLDEVAVYNTYMSAGDAEAHYRRGANRLQFQARSCNDALCAGESWEGPDGTSGTYFNELLNSSTTPPTFSLTNIEDNQYFQYQAIFETDDSGFSPELTSTSVDYTTSGGGGGTNETEAVCLDLSADLVDMYIAEMPVDPEFGSTERTYYAVRLDSQGRIEVYACSPEVADEIKILR